MTEGSRRATDRRGELSGSGLSALMAVLFAVVVILGKQVQAGELPFVMLAIRFGGQSVLLLGLVVLTRSPAAARAGGAACPRDRRHDRLRLGGGLLLLRA